MPPDFLSALRQALLSGPRPTHALAHALATTSDPVARIHLRLSNWTPPFGTAPAGFVAERGWWRLAEQTNDN